MPRIAVGGFQHETNTFAALPATLADFEAPDAWPGLVRGEAMFAAVRGINLPAAGFIDEARAGGCRLLPLAWCSAQPSGRVTRNAFETICGMLLDDLAACSSLDAVYLDLHGAMVAEHADDADGELLGRFTGHVAATDLQGLLDAAARRIATGQAVPAGLEPLLDGSATRLLGFLDEAYDPARHRLSGISRLGTLSKRPQPMTYRLLLQQAAWRDRIPPMLDVLRTELYDPVDGGFFFFNDPDQPDPALDLPYQRQPNCTPIEFCDMRMVSVAFKPGNMPL